MFFYRLKESRDDIRAGQPEEGEVKDADTLTKAAAFNMKQNFRA